MRYRSRQNKSKYPYEPALGVKTDFETLLQRFSSAGTVRYEKFAEYWRDMNMATYCAGRQTKREAREFVEQCLIVATQFLLPPSSFLVRAGAVYLLYGLYNFQLAVPKVKIRITPEQWLQITEFQTEAREQQHLDLDYIFQKLKLEKAFIFVATPDEMYVTQRVSEDKVIPDSLKEEIGMVEEVFSSSALNQLSLVHSQYQKMKQALTDEGDTSLNIVHSDLIGSIYSTLAIHKEKQAQVLQKNQIYKTKNAEDTLRDDEDNFIVADETVSVQKLLKQKAFEFSSPKSGKKNKKRATLPGKGEEECFEEMEFDVKAESEKIQHKKSTAADLFEKDESEDMPVELPQVHEIFQMPDLDSITPKLPSKSDTASGDDTEDVNSQIEKDSENKLKTSRKGKRKQSEQKKKRTSSENIKSENDVEALEGDMDSPVSKKPAKRKSKTGANESNTNCDTVKMGSKIKKKAEKSPESESYSLTSDQKQVSTDKGEEFKEMEQGIDQAKGPTAQEILQMKLNKRKKEARLGSQSKSRQKKK